MKVIKLLVLVICILLIAVYRMLFLNVVLLIHRAVLACCNWLYIASSEILSLLKFGVTCGVFGTKCSNSFIPSEERLSLRI